MNTARTLPKKACLGSMKPGFSPILWDLGKCTFSEPSLGKLVVWRGRKNFIALITNMENLIMPHLT